MPIYINKNNQQSGPYEDHVVLDQLRTGVLSPNDMGIRHGEANWQRLGDMFPDASPRATPSFTPPIAATTAGVSSSAPPAAKKGGCFKAGLIGAGLLMLLLGIAMAGGSRFIPSTSCDLAQSDKDKIDRLNRDIEKAKSDFKYDRIGPLTIELKEAMAGYEVSQTYCDGDRTRDNLIGIAGGVMAFIGFLMAVIGLFVGRRK
jgi:GYF domain 2